MLAGGCQQVAAGRTDFFMCSVVSVLAPCRFRSVRALFFAPVFWSVQAANSELEEAQRWKRSFSNFYNKLRTIPAFAGLKQAIIHLHKN